VIDRKSIREWQQGDKSDTFSRASELVYHLLTEYERPNFPQEEIHEIHKLVSLLAKDVGLLELPNH